MKKSARPQVGETSKENIGFERLVFFSDAVFAIAITLLALEIRLPEIEVSALSQRLLGLLPEIEAYALSFVIIGLYWAGHHRMFQYIVRYDYTLTWLNLLFLLCVAFLPVASAILGRYPTEAPALLFYNMALSVTALSNLLMWWYASRNHRLIEPDLSPQVNRYMFIRTGSTMGAALLATGIAFISPSVALGGLAIYALFAILSGRPR